MSDPCEGRHDLMWDPSHGGFAYCRNCNWASLDPIRKDYAMTDQEKIAAAMPGDWIKAKYRGHAFEGEVWAWDGTLLVGPAYSRHKSGIGSVYFTDVTVTPKAWPEGTVLAWVTLDRAHGGEELHHVGIVHRDGYVLLPGDHAAQAQSVIRTCNPTVLRLGGAK